jgi:HEAT repeat protein
VSLQKMLAADDVDVRWDAIVALQKIPEDWAIDLLITALADSQFISVRWRAAEALGKMGSPRAVEALAGGLSDPNFYVREKAAEALGRIGDPGALEPLIAALTDRDPDVRRRIVRAIIEIGAGAEDLLRDAMESRNALVRGAAQEAFGEIAARKKRRG